MNWKTKKTKRRVTFIWADGTPDFMIVSNAMLGCIISMLYENNRVYGIEVNLMHYTKFVEKYGGLVIPAAQKESGQI